MHIRTCMQGLLQSASGNDDWDFEQAIKLFIYIYTYTYIHTYIHIYIYIHTYMQGLLQSASGNDDWDFEQAIKLFSEFLLREDNSNVRLLLADDLTILLDSVGLDLYSYVTNITGSGSVSKILPHIGTALTNGVSE